MRKDVKFGITIGAVLFVTLAAYVVVLSRGGAMPSKADDTSKPLADVTPTETTPTTPADTTKTPDNVAPDHSAGDTSSAATDTNSPATQPTASAQPGFNWNDALTKGQTSLFASAEPQHTVTPTIGSGDAPANHDGAVVDPNTPPPLIDNVSTTQPSVVSDNVITGGPTTPLTPTGSVSVGESPRTHVVESGESLWTISEAVYGNSKYYRQIITANPRVDPNHLKVGMVLNIPALNGVDRSASVVSASTFSGKIDPATEYQVVSGDSLEGIARKLYDDSKMQFKIYDANRSLIGADENRLKVGWVLKLPSPPTISQ
jgi:LysM repeat protein